MEYVTTTKIIRITPLSPMGTYMGRCGSQAYVYESPDAEKTLATCILDPHPNDPWHEARFGGHVNSVEFHYTIRFKDDAVTH